MKKKSPSKSNSQLFRSEQWSTYATTVDVGFQESLDWIKKIATDPSKDCGFTQNVGTRMISQVAL